MGVDLKIFGVVPRDPGDIYVVEHAKRYKIGRSRNAAKRLKEAKTWLPDMQVIGIKPFWNIREKERLLHCAFAHCWYAGEWFELLDEGYEETLVEGFRGFYDDDRDMNSVDFIYWFNGDGMAEVVHEMMERGQTLPAFLKEESLKKKE